MVDPRQVKAEPVQDTPTSKGVSTSNHGSYALLFRDRTLTRTLEIL